MATQDRQRTSVRLRLILAAVAVAAGLGIAVPVVLTLTAPAAGAPPPPVMYGSGGWQDGRARPAAVYFGTGGSLFIRPVHWRSWTINSAYGRGTRWADNCVPTCAGGTYQRSPASLRLWRVRRHGHQRYFSRMTVRWTTSGGVRHQVLYRWGNPYGGTVPLWY
jgi:hypothetical protein